LSNYLALHHLNMSFAKRHLLQTLTRTGASDHVRSANAIVAATYTLARAIQ
jgi:hypothetical protein